MRSTTSRCGTSTRKRSSASRPAPRVATPRRATRSAPEAFPCTAGIDAGAIATKALILKGGGILAFSILPTGADGVRAARDAFRGALRKARLEPSGVAAAAATGYGRKTIPFATAALTEITCHARGASFLFPGTETVIDIGGQDTKIISVRDGFVRDFVMNDRCAAGTGRFLEIMSQALEIPLAEMGNEGLRARRNNAGGIRISNTCTVFAESEVVSLLSRRMPRRDIVLALHEAVADRIAGMAGRFPLGRRVTLTGGVAKNRGVADAIGRRLGVAVDIPPEPQIVGALGAALRCRFPEHRRAVQGSQP